VGLRVTGRRLTALLLAAGCHGGSPFSPSHAPFPVERPASFSFEYGSSAGMTPDFERLECSSAGCSFEKGGQAVAKISFSLTAAQLDELYRLFRENTRPGDFRAPEPTGPRPTDVGSSRRRVNVDLETYDDTTGQPFWAKVERDLTAALASAALPLTIEFDPSLSGKTVAATACGHAIGDRVPLAPGDGGWPVLVTTALPGSCEVSVSMDPRLFVSRRMAVKAPLTVHVGLSSGALTLDQDGDAAVAAPGASAGTR